MEKRLLLAVLLMSAVIFLTNWLFPPPEPAPEAAVTEVAADSAVVVADSAAPTPPVAVAPPAAAPARAETVVVTSDLYRYAFSTRGVALARAEMLRYPSYTQEGPVQLVPARATDFLAYRLAVGGDTIDLATLPFTPSARSLDLRGADAPRSLTFSYAQPDGFGVELTYTFEPDGYLVDVRGQLVGLNGRPATLLTEVGPGIAPNEAFDHHSEQQLSVVTRSPDDITRIRFSKLEGQQTVDERLTWAGVKDKYFLVAVVAGDSTPLSGARVAELPTVQHRYPEVDEVVTVPQGHLTTALPIGPDGRFAYQAYVGPQEFERLSAVGYDLENVTQYAYQWLEAIIRPVAAAILWVLEWMHDALGVAYGWALLLFGVLMRVVLWPLNTKAMRAQMKNMAVQPLMQEIREKYKNDPQKQQEEMVRLYKEEGFNPLAGCLPMLVPFPVLITLFFVFQNTIAFRGAEFLWLPDLSLRDPLYILPVFLMASMFGLQLLSARTSGMEQNAQMKMMMYVMPLMVGVFFFTLPSGLNLYYATTNVASMPQQILIGRERKRAKEAMDRANAKPTPGKKGTRKR